MMVEFESPLKFGEELVDQICLSKRTTLYNVVHYT